MESFKYSVKIESSYFAAGTYLIRRMVDKTIKRTLKKIFLEILQLCLNALFLEREKENNLLQKNHQ